MEAAALLWLQTRARAAHARPSFAAQSYQAPATLTQSVSADPQRPAKSKTRTESSCPPLLPSPPDLPAPRSWRSGSPCAPLAPGPAWKRLQLRCCAGARVGCPRPPLSVPQAQRATPSPPPCCCAPFGAKPGGIRRVLGAAARHDPWTSRWESPGVILGPRGWGGGWRLTPSLSLQK